MGPRGGRARRRLRPAPSRGALLPDHRHGRLGAPDLPVVEDPDRYGHYREEGGGILVGLFEPVAASWSLYRVPRDVQFASLPPDWDRVGPLPEAAINRFPSLHDAGVRTMFGALSCSRPTSCPSWARRRAAVGFFVACGLNSLGIPPSGGVGSLTAQWINDGVPPVDVTGLHLLTGRSPTRPRAGPAAIAPGAAGGAVRRRVVPVVARDDGPERAAIGRP